MLKKAMLGVVLGLMMVPAAAMAITADHAVYTVKVMNNGKKVASQSIAVIAGESAPFSVTQGISYPAESKIKNGKAFLLPATITTGVSGVLRESRKNHSALDLHLTDTRLIKMGAIVADSQTIDQPEMDTQGFQDTLILQKGQSMVLRGFDKESGDVSVTVSRAQ
ncbi:MAG: hypothetical protein ACYC45_03455 [Acidithiobacillus ferriphilus]|uniref:hypothetical protein n=1 Tax=Acidithiobacillus ferriphilus TaxID=1689834 RepID=UPI001C07D826|nr:hypothetical protein [Acidithiobacillus ferriphilus]MBU2828628.1 hypothetical protein [Acidithiobacillus ferriphilus]MBU2844972.1 hypothetical protein [Acidithiobacillus ferriphilus]